MCSCWTVDAPARAATSRLLSPTSYVHSNAVYQAHREPDILYQQLYGWPHSGQAAQVLAPWHMAHSPLSLSSMPAVSPYGVLSLHGDTGKSAQRNKTKPTMVSPVLVIRLRKPTQCDNTFTSLVTPQWLGTFPQGCCETAGATKHV